MAGGKRPVNASVARELERDNAALRAGNDAANFALKSASIAMEDAKRLQDALRAQLAEKERELRYSKLSENILRADANASKLESDLLRSTLTDVRDQLTAALAKNEEYKGLLDSMADCIRNSHQQPLPKPPEEKR
jgi:flavin-dependent dehydrogenase